MRSVSFRLLQIYVSLYQLKTYPSGSGPQPPAEYLLVPTHVKWPGFAGMLQAVVHRNLECVLRYGTYNKTQSASNNYQTVYNNTHTVNWLFFVLSVFSCNSHSYIWFGLFLFREFFLFLHRMSALQPFPSELFLLNCIVMQDPPSVWKGRTYWLFIAFDDFP